MPTCVACIPHLSAVRGQHSDTPRKTLRIRPDWFAPDECDRRVYSSTVQRQTSTRDQALALGRAGVDAEDAIQRAGPEQPRQERDKADVAEGRAGADKRDREEADSQSDAEDAIGRSNVAFHGSFSRRWVLVRQRIQAPYPRPAGSVPARPGITRNFRDLRTTTSSFSGRPRPPNVGECPRNAGGTLGRIRRAAAAHARGDESASEWSGRHTGVVPSR